MERRPGLVTLSAIGLSAMIIVPLATAKPTPRAAQVYTVVIDKMKFGAVPASLRVGDTVLWVNRDIFRHTATAADGSFNVDLLAGKNGKIRMKKAGTVAFSCTFHPGMKGLLKVQR